MWIQGADYSSILKDLQHSVDTWEGSLKAKCKAIIPEKTFWFLIDSPGILENGDISELKNALEFFIEMTSLVSALDWNAMRYIVHRKH